MVVFGHSCRRIMRASIMQLHRQYPFPDTVSFGKSPMKLAAPSLLSSCILAICLASFRVGAGVTLTTLISFNGTNGANPSAGLVQGHDGSFYGTAVRGGAFSNGVVFRIGSSGDIAVLVSFARTNGASPISEMLQGTDGKL